MMKAKNKKILFFIFLLAICLLPKLYFMENRITASYSSSPIILAQMSEENEKIVVHPFSPPLGYRILQNQVDMVSRRIGLTSILLTIKLITGLSYLHMMFFPIGGLLIFFGSYYLAWTLTHDRLLTYFYVIFMAYDPSIIFLSYNTSAHAWAFFLLFIFLATFYKLFKSFTIKKFALLILIFLAIASIYYTTEVFVILVVVVYAILLILLSTLAKKFYWSKTSALVIIFSISAILGFILFDPLFKSHILRYFLESSENPITIFKEGILKTSLFAVKTTPFVTFALPPNKYIHYLNVTIYLLITLPFIFIFSSLIFNILRKKLKLDILLLVSIFVATIILFSGLYLINLPMRFEYVLLMFPLGIVILLKNASQKMRKVVIPALIVLIMLKFAFNIYQPMYTTKKFEEIDEPGVNWAAEHITSENLILGDLVVLGQLQFLNPTLWLRPYSYSAITKRFTYIDFIYAPKPEIKNFFAREYKYRDYKYKYRYYILSDRELEKAISPAVPGFRLKPSPKLARELNKVEVMNLVYSDGKIRIYRVNT